MTNAFGSIFHSFNSTAENLLSGSFSEILSRSISTSPTSLPPSRPTKADTERARLLEQIVELGVNLPDNIVTILDLVISGGIQDDRDHIIEHAMRFVSALPEQSAVRQKITEMLVDKLWNSMQHPPLSYVGPEFDFRMPDGSNNNIMYPNLGKAGTPYARTVNQGHNMMNGARPDPGLLFDTLMARDDSTYRENPSGISSMLFYHASIITHDIFRTDPTNKFQNNTSSYLDLSPLYGINKEAQDSIRTFHDGKIKPDTFAEDRLLHLPPGISIMLIMYSRFHNYVVERLAAINEGGQFKLPRDPNDTEAWKCRDEWLFQTGRLITCGLYVNISLHDYLRGIANMPSSESTWTLDPRIEIEKKLFDKVGLPRGVGNQVSCEFNLLYRFHSAISKRDEEWTNKLFQKVFPGKDLTTLSMPEFLEGVQKLARNTSTDPGKREFAGLKRDKITGRFNDEELVKILQESIEDPAGAFGALNTPKVLKPIEILGILQGRSWHIASLNEFRKFFRVKPYENFEEISPDPYIQNTLRTLYGHVDNIEMYPGMMIEATKPRMDPGMGLCGPYTVTKAVFSDAIALVRGDRFATVDYNPAKLTNWGFKEVQPDRRLLGGARMHQLIMTAFPSFFKPNSVYALQPFYTPKRNKEIFTTFGTVDLYDFELPRNKAPKRISVTSHAAINNILLDGNRFKATGNALDDLIQNREIMVALTNSHEDTFTKAILKKNLPHGPYMEQFKGFTEEWALKLLKRKKPLGKSWQIDIIQDLANPLTVHFCTALLALPMKSDFNPTAAFTEQEMVSMLSEINLYLFHNEKPKAFSRLRDAREKAAILHTAIKTDLQAKLGSLIPQPCSPGLTPASVGGGVQENVGRWKKHVDEIESRVTALVRHGLSHLNFPAFSLTENRPLEDWGYNLALRLMSAGGYDLDQISWNILLIASALLQQTTKIFAHIMNFFLISENSALWAKIQQLCKLSTTTVFPKGRTETDELLAKYVSEAYRLSMTDGLFREAQVPPGQNSIIITDESVDRALEIQNGDVVYLDIASANRDQTFFPDPLTFNPLRPTSPATFPHALSSTFPHLPAPLINELSTCITVSLLKTLARAVTNLRRTPGPEGMLNVVPVEIGTDVPTDSRLALYVSKDWSELVPCPESLKLIFDDIV